MLCKFFFIVRALFSLLLIYPNLYVLISFIPQNKQKIELKLRFVDTRVESAVSRAELSCELISMNSEVTLVSILGYELEGFGCCFKARSTQWRDKDDQVSSHRQSGPRCGALCVQPVASLLCPHTFGCTDKTVFWYGTFLLLSVLISVSPKWSFSYICTVCLTPGGIFSYWNCFALSQEKQEPRVSCNILSDLQNYLGLKWYHGDSVMWNRERDLLESLLASVPQNREPVTAFILVLRCSMAKIATVKIEPCL